MVSNSGKGLRLLRWALALFLFLALLALPAPSSGREGVNHLRDLFVYRGDSLLRVVALFEREVELPQRALSRSERAFTLSIPGAAMEPERRVFRVEGGPLELVEAREKEGERILITGRLRESQEAAFREVRLEAEGKTLSLALPLPLPAAPPGEKLAGGRAAEALVDKVLGAGPRAEAAPSGSPPRGRALEAGAGQLGPASPSLFGIGLKLALALGAILALFLGGASLFSRLAKGGPLGRKKRLIRLINKSYIGPKKSIALVEVAGEVGARGGHLKLQHKHALQAGERGQPEADKGQGLLR